MYDVKNPSYPPMRVDIIGVPISAVNMEICLDYLSRCFDSVRSGYICAANVHTTVMAREDASYLAVQSSSVLTLPDGKPLAIVGKLCGCKDMEKTTGFCFLKSIFCDERFLGKKHYFYGSTRETVEAAVGKVRQEYANIQICGYEPSVFRELTETEVDELAQRVNEAGADFLWIALGAPRQELLMYRLCGKTNALMTGVGGVFNILAGQLTDAPKWMQNAGLEWLYRLCQEPRRLFKRYLISNSKFIWYVTKR